MTNGDTVTTGENQNPVAKKKTTIKKKLEPVKAGATKEEKVVSVKKGYGALPIKNLLYADWNYKTDDDEILAKLTKNIKKNDLIENLIVRELDNGKFEVVNGNHRLKVMHILKKSEAMCFNLGKITRSEAQRIAVETNETRFASDDTRLASLLKEISADFDVSDLLTTVPFSQDEINDLLKLADFDWESLDKDDTGYSKDKDGEDNMRVIELKLPEEVATEFQFQLDRFKKALRPNEVNLAKISNVVPIEIISRHMAQIPDNKLVSR